MEFWPHAPLHSFNEIGTYMITASTLHKNLFFKQEKELDLLQDLLLKLADHYQWRLEAWAVFPNHYHFIAQSSDNPDSLRKFIPHLHASSTKELNELHGTLGRKVWYQFWDSKITFQKSYLATLNYIMQNPVKNKIVANAKEYRWCSASWFEKNVTRAYFKSVINLNVDDVKVNDDF